MGWPGTRERVAWLELDLCPGDEISYEIVEGRVTLAKVSSPALSDDPFRTFEEWHSEADTGAYADL